MKFVGPDDLIRLDKYISPADGALTSICAAASRKVWTEEQNYGGAYLIPFSKVEALSETGNSKTCGGVVGY
jgi:hypothetical protein